MEQKIILASVSERRARILSECGIAHEVVTSGAEEVCPEGVSVSEVVQMNAKLKAEAVAGRMKGHIIIGADTLVIYNDEIIGKPEDENKARELLKKFSGSEVKVYTGLCVIDTSLDKKALGFEESCLSVVSLSVGEIGRFFRLMASYDKAGGFSIEGVGSLLFDDIKGSYFNILGLPMIRLRKLFNQVDLNILDFIQ